MDQVDIRPGDRSWAAAARAIVADVADRVLALLAELPAGPARAGGSPPVS